jgi:hypothetical protein
VICCSPNSLIITHFSQQSRDSSVGTALGYGLDNRGSRFRFPAGAKIFFFTTASRPALGREADHSPSSSVEVKECVELYIHSPNTPSWRGA